MIVATRRLDAEGKAAVVVAEGKLAGREASDRLRRALRAAVERHERVVADLVGASALDPTTVGVLAEAAAAAGLAGKEFAVAAVGEVADVVKKVGFAEALGLRGTVEE